MAIDRSRMPEVTIQPQRGDLSIVGDAGRFCLSFIGATSGISHQQAAPTELQNHPTLRFYRQVAPTELGLSHYGLQSVSRNHTHSQ
jgi:hypothetical protein